MADLEVQNAVGLDNGWAECTCEKCGTVFLMDCKKIGEDGFLRLDPQAGKAWPLCSKCYDGPRGTQQQIDDLLNDGDGK